MINCEGGWGQRELIFSQRRILDQSRCHRPAAGMVGSGGVAGGGGGWVAADGRRLGGKNSGGGAPHAAWCCGVEKRRV